MGKSFLQTGTIRHSMDAFRALQVLFPAPETPCKSRGCFCPPITYHYFTHLCFSSIFFSHRVLRDVVNPHGNIECLVEATMNVLITAFGTKCKEIITSPARCRRKKISSLIIACFQFTVFQRCNPIPLLKNIGEVRLAGKAEILADFCDAFLCIFEKCFGFLHFFQRDVL